MVVIVEEHPGTCESMVRLVKRATGGLVLDSMTMPSMPDGLGMWVIDFGVAGRITVESRYWVLAEDRHDAFLRSIREENVYRPRRAKTIDDLAAELALQAEHGGALVFDPDAELRY